MSFSPLMFPADGVDNGSLGRLTDCISCTVKEALDGKTYDLEMEYKMFGSNYSMIAVDRIVAVPVSPASKDVDYFRIYFIDEDIVSQITTVYARQDTLYRLQNTVVDAFETTGTPSTIWSAMSAEAFGDGLSAVNFVSAISSSYKSKSETPCSMYDAMFADTGLVSVSGAKIRYRRSSVFLDATRGSDCGEIVRSGKNITQLQRTVDESDLVTAVLPYWRGSVNGEYVTVLGTLCVADNKGSAYHHVISLDVSSDVDRPEDAESGWKPAAASVTDAGKEYVSREVSGDVDVSISAEIVSFEGYTDNISLGDTVLIQHTGMGINKKSTVVETVYNVLTDRYDEIRVDSVRDSLADTIYKASTTKKNASGTPGKDGSDATVTSENINAALGYSPANSDDLTSHTSDTTIHVTAANKSTWNGMYTKPSDGIPASDLASDVQTAITKATAIVDYLIERGTSDTYTYEKYASGTMRVWGAYQFSAACTTDFGSASGWYCTGGITPDAYPVEFAEPPVVSIEWRSAVDGYGAVVWRSDKGRANRPSSVMLCRPGSVDTLSGYLDIMAVGKYQQEDN